MRSICNSLVIIQAPADIPYALDIIEKENSPDILVVNVNNVYRFLKKLNLRFDISYLPYPQYKHNYYFNLLRFRAYYRKEFKKFIKDKYTEINKVYFFSRYEDSLTSFFVDRIIKKYPAAEIIYVNHYDNYDDDNTYHLSLKQWLFYCANCFITGIPLKKGYKSKIPEFDIKRYTQIKETRPFLNKETVKKYLVKYSEPNSVLLLFNKSCGQLMKDVDYKNSLEILLKELKEKGMIIYAKGHPREGCPRVIEQISDQIIPAYIPSEFVDITSFKFVIGLNSVSIAHIARDFDVKTFSMLYCFPCQETQFIYEYLVEQSDSKLIFPNSIKEIFDK